MLELNTFLSDFADILQIDVENISADTVLEELPEWDSMTKLSLMSYVRKQYKIRIPVKDLLSFSKIGDIFAYLKQGEQK